VLKLLALVARAGRRKPRHQNAPTMSTSFQLDTSNLADGDKFSGAIRQVGRTYRLSAPLYF